MCRMECKYGNSCGYDMCVPEFCKEYEPKQLTNADRIRAMSDEELAEWALFDAISIGKEYNNSLLGLIDWLQQPVKEGADHE